MDDVDRNIDPELASWVDELTARYEAAGLSRADARRRALLETGGVAQVKDLVRDARPRSFFDPIQLEHRWRDFTRSWRSLAATPLATTTIVLTLAATAGACLGLAGLVSRVLLSPPAGVATPDSVMTMALHSPNDPRAVRMGVSYALFTRIADAVGQGAEVAVFQRQSTSVVLNGDQRRIDAMAVSGDYFDLLGARAEFGRALLPADDTTGAMTPVVVLSHALWATSFGADLNVLGRSIRLGGADFTIVGVAPRDFTGHSLANVDVWMPISSAMRGSPGWEHDAYRTAFSLVTRVKTGTSVAQAEAQASAASDQSARLSSIVGADVNGSDARVAWWLTGVSVVMLVTGLANAAVLMVVRAIRRSRDTAIRAALGASRAQLTSEAAMEAAVLALVSVATALVLANWTSETVRRVLFPGIVTRDGLIASSWAIVALTAFPVVLVTLGTNIWQVRRTGGIESGTGTPRRTRIMTSLLVTQTGLSALLLSGAAMFGHSLFKLGAQDLGMTMDGVAFIEFERSQTESRSLSQVLADAVPQLRSLPGVDAVTGVNSLPFAGHMVIPVSVPGRAESPSVDGQLPFLNAATPEFMSILGIQVAEGRTFTAADQRGEPVVIVNQTMARGVWPGESVIGKCFRIGFDPNFDPSVDEGPPKPSDALPCRRVIGVSRDARQRSIVPEGHEAALMQYFVPYSQVPKPPFSPGDGLPVTGILLRSKLPVEDLASTIRRTVIGSRTELPFLKVVPYAQLLDRQLRPWQVGTSLLVLFSALALGLAAVGLQAAFAHAVAERRREMAIRLAMGARPSGVLRMVLSESMRLAAIGAVAGCGVAIAVGRWGQSLLFETSPSDPRLLSPVVGVLLAVALAATVWPAFRASREDPNQLLRVS